MSNLIRSKTRDPVVVPRRELLRPHTPPLVTDIFPNCLFDLSTSLFRSYKGNGANWKSPANRAYDQTLTGSFSFVGEPDSPDAYIQHNGSSYSVLAGANTAAINLLHQSPSTGLAHTYYYCFRHVAAVAIQAFMSTRLTGASIGEQIYTFTDNKIYITQYGTTAVTPTLGGAALSDATDYCIFVSHNDAQNRSRLWQNSDTGLEVAHNYSDTTSNAAAKLAIAALANGSNPVQNGHRLYDAGILPFEFTDADAAVLRRFLSDRRGGKKYGLTV